MTYPLHGECDGSRALLRGFAHAAGSSLTEPRVDDRAVDAAALGSGGAFQLEVPRAQPEQASRVLLEARFADGARIEREVALGPCAAAPTSSSLSVDEGSPYAVWVRADAASSPAALILKFVLTVIFLIQGPVLGSLLLL